MTRALLYLALPWLALALLPAPALTAAEPPWLAGMELAAEGHHMLPVGLLARVRLRYERSRQRTIGTGRGKDGKGGTCGPYQLLSRDWRSPDGWELCQDAMGPPGPWRAAARLDRSRARCQREKNCPCLWAHYNWRDRTALCKALEE